MVNPATCHQIPRSDNSLGNSDRLTDLFYHPCATAGLPVCCYPLSAMNMTNPDLHCAVCGGLFNPGERSCADCGAELPPAVAAVAACGEEGEVPWTVTHVTIGLMLFLVLLVAAAFVARGAGSLYPAHEQALQTWVGVHLLALAAGAVVWVLGARMAVSPTRALGFVAPRTSLGMASLLALAALAASILGTFAYGLAVDALGLEFLRPPEIEDGTIFPGVGILLTLQALAVVTPLSEELLFRGFALRGMIRSIGTGPAVVATALLFSVLHLKPEVMIPIFITGLALGLLRVKTGSLWPCIAAHAGQNALALLATRFL